MDGLLPIQISCPFSTYPLICSSACILFFWNRFLWVWILSLLQICSFADLYGVLVTWMRPHIPGFFSSWLIAFPMILQGPSLCLPVLQFPNFCVHILWMSNCLPDVCTTSCLRFNLSPGILQTACLGYWKEAVLEVFWGAGTFQSMVFSGYRLRCGNVRS